MTIHILAPAREDLDHIEDWVLEKFGEEAAARALQKLYQTFRMLSEFQQAGIARPEIEASPTRFFSSPPNWIMYQPGNPLVIRRVFSARTDMP